MRHDVRRLENGSVALRHMRQELHAARLRWQRHLREPGVRCSVPFWFSSLPRNDSLRERHRRGALRRAVPELRRRRQWRPCVRERRMLHLVPRWISPVLRRMRKQQRRNTLRCPVPTMPRRPERRRSMREQRVRHQLSQRVSRVRQRVRERHRRDPLRNIVRDLRDRPDLLFGQLRLRAEHARLPVDGRLLRRLRQYLRHQLHEMPDR